MSLSHVTVLLFLCWLTLLLNHFMLTQVFHLFEYNRIYNKSSKYFFFCKSLYYANSFRFCFYKYGNVYVYLPP